MYDPPMSSTPHIELIAKLEEQFETLTPQTKKAARYVIDQPADVAFYSMREVAKRAGVPPGTLLRLSSALGLESYNSFREVYRNGMLDSQSGSSFTGKARDLQRAKRSSSSATLLNEVLEIELDNLKKTFAANDPATVERAVKLLERGERVFVLGQRSCFPAAYFFNYVFRFLRSTSHLVDGQGGAFVDDLRAIGPGDTLLAISIEPYTAEVVGATEFARAQGANVVVITDSRVSPLRKSATELLLTSNRSASFFHSILSPLAVIQALIALMAARGGEKTLASIAHAEEQLEWFNVYWPQRGIGSVG